MVKFLLRPHLPKTVSGFPRYVSEENEKTARLKPRLSLFLEWFIWVSGKDTTIEICKKKSKKFKKTASNNLSAVLC